VFQDILENEDVKLDNMFIASLVGDIIRVSIGGVKSSIVIQRRDVLSALGNLKSDNCHFASSETILT
jgi:atrial natriuretic peptide receptor A